MEAPVPKARRLNENTIQLEGHSSPLFSTWQWVTIIGGLIVTSVGLAAFAFTSFEGKEDAKAVESRVEKRLDSMEQRIERKLDRFDQKLDELILQRRK